MGIPIPLQYLSKCLRSLKTADGHEIVAWELNIPDTSGVLSAWGARFRQHYCADSDIEDLRAGTGLSRSEYLTQLVFPDKTAKPGPSIRAGDFAELLVTDYVEYLLGYWVPRGKYAEKASRNESVKGADILGLKISDVVADDPNDTLLAFEVKAQAAGGKYSGRLQAAIDDSSLDFVRKGITLNAAKRRLILSNQQQDALKIQRFQNPSDRPYVYRSGAAAILSDDAYDEDLMQKSTVVGAHDNVNGLELIVIRSTGLMNLIHALFDRAANEA